MKKKENPYTEKEKKVMASLVTAVALFHKIKTTHPCHEKDFIDGIHKCQNVITHKILQRKYPKEFPSHRYSLKLELI